MRNEWERSSVDVADLPPLHCALVPARRTSVRLAMFAGLLGALTSAIYFVGAFAAATVDGAAYASAAAYADAVGRATLIGYLLTLPAVLLFFAKAAPKVSYRSRDALLVFVPVWSYVFAARVLWRLTGLAERRWPHRADEFDLEALTA
ncbi:MAG: hypothetical protein ACT4QF_03460 [Sporichthyaceae bacterium]